MSDSNIDWCNNWLRVNEYIIPSNGRVTKLTVIDQYSNRIVISSENPYGGERALREIEALLNFISPTEPLKALELSLTRHRLIWHTLYPSEAKKLLLRGAGLEIEWEPMWVS